MMAVPAGQLTMTWTDALRRRLSWWLQPQISSAARDRRNVGVLLVAVFIAVAPHFLHLPWWSSALFGVLWFWRAWLTVARRPPPGRFAMIPLLATAPRWSGCSTAPSLDMTRESICWCC